MAEAEAELEAEREELRRAAGVDPGGGDVGLSVLAGRLEAYHEADERRAEAEACWRGVTAEVLLVAGRNSDFRPPDDLPFPRSRVAWIEDSGHMLHFEQPGALAALIEDFLVNSSSTV